MYFIIRVTASQEKITADVLQNKISKTSSGIYSLVMPYGMRGYLVIEAENEIACRDLILNEPHVKGMLSKPLDAAELEKMLASKQAIQEIGVSDIIEFFAGPFKGYKAKVMKVDSAKDEITVELMDVAVPIPVTTKSNLARIIERANKG
ncbi:MAG: transcription elongation factor Spt5 [Candidatus Micrarchaeota archaeon]|nr:transcription elongation factor Spt5 [Candidatus Micrarchaeota archaeon]MDE1859880.1 transcription elongation factor Spt5 [Candidatus Micrarchaeota archaeon]